jgi:hypothetical protein
MARLTPRQYQRRTLLAMSGYVGFMLLAWPMVRTADSTLLKVLLALAPVVPMLYVIGLMARRILDADELEQRTHLVALGAATAVIGGLSLVGGFLAAAQVFKTDGAILIWVFPVMMLSYGITRWWVGRRYGMSLSCEDDRGMPIAWRFLLAAAASAAIAWLGRHKFDDMGLGVLCGMSAAFLFAGVVLSWMRWRARRGGRGAA